ncbi:dihydrodipicolinate synthase family protein [Psychromarinibacter halotolerans]|uniref:Dihydrodipicolinate synthase family protein n=1 Tax=Psychromarinibacter halotolerans TaxID=1775175 RepID=A0ABV7GUS0_9RHOB|nr:dihydrodipicolinate synthase family protein [Psychromarinibacter halotolerans]MDF0595148.1 dihydrodipicolinate synthase family protein [Psychromarinibacter halotolerans]
MTRTPEIWPPLVTPFDARGQVDHDALADLVAFNIRAGVTGLLVTGLSAEPFVLSEAERLAILRTCVTAAAGQIRLAAAVYPEGPDDWARVIDIAHGAGADTAVLLTAHLAPQDADDAAVCAALDRIVVDTTGDLGLYEAPRPFKRLLSDDVFAHAAQSGRFVFHKDTCLDLDRIGRRVALAAGTPLTLLNAEMASFRASFALGAGGFCGLMANIHPRALPLAATEADDTLSLLLAATDAALEKNYPASAKLLLAEREGLGLNSHARTLERGTTSGDCTSLFAADTLIRRHLAAIEAGTTRSTGQLVG